MNEPQNKRELLKDKVVDLVKMFVNANDGITQQDIEKLFGVPGNINSQVSTALAEMPIRFI